MRIDTTVYAQILGNVIRKKRKEIGWTQERLAQEAQACSRNIGRIENGERYPTTLTLYRLRKALNMEQDPLILGVMERAEQIITKDE